MSEESSVSFAFYKFPFLVLTSALCIGILAGFEFGDLRELPLSLLLVIGLFLFVFHKKVWFSSQLVFLFTFLSFFLLGVLLMQSSLGYWKKNQLSEVYEKGDALLVKLDEVGTSDNLWKKMTGKVLSVYHDGSQIDVDEQVVMFVKSTNFGCETGDILLVASELTEIKNSGNPGEFDATNYWNKKGFRHMLFVGDDAYKIIENAEETWYSKALNGTRDYLKGTLENNLKGKELGIALALILGDKSNLDVETRNSFTNTGAMHVLAVSGLHVGIIMQILMVIMGFFAAVLSRKNAVLIVVVIMWIYAIITGLSPSVIRAVFMFTFLAIAQQSGKNYNSINILFFTAFVLLLINPFTLYDIGFQLSFLAMLGIFLFYKPIEQILFIENKLLRKVWQGTAIGFAAQLMTTPLSLYYFHQFPNYFVLTNIGLMASSGLILGLGLFIFSIGWWKFLARFTGLILSFVIFVSLAFIEWVEGLPGAVAYGFDVPILMVLAITALILLAFLYAKKPAQMAVVLSLGLVVLVTLVMKRFDNHKVNEVCIFNARQIVVTVRKGDALFCFYKSKKKDFPKVKFIVEAYAKLHPSTIQYCSLDKKDWEINSNTTHISTTNGKGSIDFSVNDKLYSVIFSDYQNTKKSSKGMVKIGMPWVESEIDHSLNDGAFVVSL